MSIDQCFLDKLKKIRDMQKLVFGKKKKSNVLQIIPLLPVIFKSVDTIDVVWDTEVEEIMCFVE